MAVIAAKPPFGIRDLAIDGKDVIDIMRELGLAGPDFAGDSRVGAALQHCLEQVLDEPQNNDPATLRRIVRDFLTSGK